MIRLRNWWPIWLQMIPPAAKTRRSMRRGMSLYWDSISKSMRRYIWIRNMIRLQSIRCCPACIVWLKVLIPLMLCPTKKVEWSPNIVRIMPNSLTSYVVTSTLEVRIMSVATSLKRPSVSFRRILMLPSSRSLRVMIMPRMMPQCRQQLIGLRCQVIVWRMQKARCVIANWHWMTSRKLSMCVNIFVRLISGRRMIRLTWRL